eukprot:scaffold22839_cov171-Amphora_coffeaeformis.AAC.8
MMRLITLRAGPAGPTEESHRRSYVVAVSLRVYIAPLNLLEVSSPPIELQSPTLTLLQVMYTYTVKLVGAKPPDDLLFQQSSYP